MPKGIGKPIAKISRETVDYQGWFTLCVQVGDIPSFEVRSQFVDDVVGIASLLKVRCVLVATGLLHYDDEIETKLTGLGVKLGTHKE